MPLSTHRFFRCFALLPLFAFLALSSAGIGQPSAGGSLRAEDVAALSGLPDNALIVHYHDNDKRYDRVGLWTWDATSAVVQPPETEQELAPRGRTDFGVYFVVDLDRYGAPGEPDAIGLLPRFDQDWNQRDGADRTWRERMGREVYLVAGQSMIFTERPSLAPSVVAAYLDRAPAELRLHKNHADVLICF